MELQFVKKPSKKSLFILPVFAKHAAERDGALRNILKKLKRTKEFSAKSGQIFFLFQQGGKLPSHILLLGLGDIAKLNATEVMECFGGVVKQVPHHRPHIVSVFLPDELHTHSQAIAEACVMGSYQPAAPYKTGKSAKKLAEEKVETLEVIGLEKSEGAKYAFQKGAAIGDAVNRVRDWVNAPPNYAHADFFDQKAKEIAKETGAALTILRKKEIEKLKMGMLLGVNRGSHQDPRLTILDYRPREADPREAPLVIVGKGILFDSGGYNLKPRGYIEDMQLDKAGAAAVFAIIQLLPKLGIKKRVIGVAPFTENLIGGHALKPSEILTSYSGKTVEVTNTDGEGRLVLGDAIAYAIDRFKPRYIIDIATLTGACMVALGDRYAGLLGNDDELMKKLRAAGKETDELLWQLPLHKDHAEKMRGQYADLRNADLGTERDAGASKGAAFIQAFIGKNKWAHLDIAGPAFTKNPKKYEHKGATGFGVRVLARFLEQL